MESIRNYRNENGDFLSLANCGKKSNIELLGLCINNHSNNVINNSKRSFNPERNRNNIEYIYLNLTRLQKDVINSFILVNTNSLNVRSKNAISLYLEHNLKIKNFALKILQDKEFNFKNIPNVGTKCVPELKKYVSTIKDFMIEVSQFNKEKKLISLKNNFLIQRTFSIPKIPDEILESESIFKLTIFLLDQNALFDETQTIIVKKSLRINQSHKAITLNEIAKIVKVTRERVRQIRKACVENLLVKFLFIQNFNDDLFQKYNIDTNSNQIEIDSDLINLINSTNNTNLSRAFVTYILYVYLYKRYSLIGNINDVLLTKTFKSSNRHNWNNFYLIEKEIAIEFDFDSFVNDIDSRIRDRINESYSFNFKSYLSKFLTNDNIRILDIIFSFCENIINEEFELYLDLDENLVFRRNTIKQIFEYPFEALEQLGKPSKVKEIFERVKENHPDYNTNESKIRASMKRSNGFVPIGRTSVFGLKKWEKELLDFKGGTIRGIVADFLSQFNEPKHISDITNHVLKFRPKSNKSSILSNLKLDESGLYVFYKNSQIGLSTKGYKDIHIKQSKTKRDILSWDEKFKVLIQFIETENRLPHSNNCPEKEKKLCRWFKSQKRKGYNGELEKNKEMLLNEIANKYPQKIRKRQDSFNCNIDKLIEFINENRRIPNSRDPNESNLYQFYYRKKKSIQEKNPSKPKEHKLLELIEIYKSPRYAKFKMDDLINFINENRRMPYYRNSNEKNLYHFYFRMRKLFTQNKLSSSEKVKFIAVEKTIQKMKYEN